MKAPILSRTLSVADARQAAVFADPLRRRLLLSLVARERSIAELAAALGIELKRLHYHVTALARLGLVVVAGERPRRGRPVKLYRAVAEAFFVADGVAEAAPSDALAAELRRALQRQRDRSPGGSCYDADAEGRPRMRRVDAGGAASSIGAEHWRALRLRPADAQRLALELAACLGRYPSVAGGAEYLVHAALARR